MNTTHKINLLSKTYSADEIGNRIEVVTKKPVFANISSISSKEFFDAGQNGLKPDHKFIMREFEYNGEDSLEFNEVVYSIYRTFSREDGFVELYTEKKVG